MNTPSPRLRPRGFGAPVRGIAFVAILFLATTGFGIAQAKSFIWKISSKTKRQAAPSYILGSIHMGKKSFYPLPKAVLKAFATSKVLVLEARPDKAMAAMGALLKKGMYMPPDSLQKHISPKTWAKIEAKLKGKTMLLTAVGQMKAWVAAITVSALELKAAGFDPKLGVENHLLARVGKKRIAVLEGMVWQLNLFSSFSERDQELFLLYTLEQSGQTQKMMPKMVSLWKHGDAAGLAKLIHTLSAKDKRLRPIEKKLLDDRNVSMTKTMIRMMKASKDAHFFVVGAAHLVGPKGIVRRLAKRGYRIEQL